MTDPRQPPAHQAPQELRPERLGHAGPHLHADDLALALSLPQGLAYAYEIRIATFGVVVFSVMLQGLTMPLLLRKLKLA